ncbi:F0F1 ATP synthase subunit B [Patescibacteria group bacterium]|nr:F0F1 ATP synthase subunit B [Patescibacteria group bacterium]MBU1705159.1 F0F1 ATP synthase subunit B [Patescibacteria group bacterium]
MSEATIINEAAQAAESAGGLGALGINLKIFIAQLINFVVVLLVLWKWAYTPIVKMLQKRSETIEKSLKDAAQIEVRLSDLEHERKQVINEARNQAAKIMEQTKADAEARREEMTQKAKREVENIVTSGKNQLQQEKEAMLRAAREGMVEIALAAAKKILSETIDEDKAKTMAAKVVDKMV